MRLFHFEMKKAAYSSRIAVMAAAFAVMQLLMCFALNGTYNYRELLHGEAYKAYLEEFGGKTSKEKKEALLLEESRIAEGEKLINGLYMKLKNGECTPSEYDDAVTEYRQITEQKAAFSQIKSRYEYCELYPEQRYVIEENGWYSLLFEIAPDFVTAVAVVFAVANIFCREYETDMHRMLMSTPNGKRKTYKAKLATSFFFIFMFWALSVLVKLVYSAGRFGLCNFTYPVQSLSMFSSCEYELTLFGAFAVISALKLLGALTLGAVTTLLSCLIKKSLITVFSSIIISVLPYFLIDETLVLKYFPFAGLFWGSRYLCGVETVVDDLYEYVPIDAKSLVFTCVFAAVLLLGGVVFCGVLRNGRRSCEN